MTEAGQRRKAAQKTLRRSRVTLSPEGRESSEEFSYCFYRLINRGMVINIL